MRLGLSEEVTNEDLNATVQPARSLPHEPIERNFQPFGYVVNDG